MEKNKFCFNYYHREGYIEPLYSVQTLYYANIPGTKDFYEIPSDEYNKYYEILDSYFRSIKRTDIVQTVYDVRKLFMGTEEGFLNVKIQNGNLIEEVSYLKDSDLVICSFECDDKDKKFKVYSGEDFYVELSRKNAQLSAENQDKLMKDVNESFEKIVRLKTLPPNKQAERAVMFDIFTARHLCDEDLTLRFEKSKDGQLIIPTKKLVYTNPGNQEGAK